MLDYKVFVLGLNTNLFGYSNVMKDGPGKRWGGICGIVEIISKIKLYALLEN